MGGALALLHRQPDHPWTVAKLAAVVGASRSLVARRYTQYLREPVTGSTAFAANVLGSVVYLGSIALLRTPPDYQSQTTMVDRS